MQFKYFSLLPFVYAQNACQDPGQDVNSIRTDLGADTMLYICNQGYATSLGTPQITLTCNDGVWGPQDPPSVSPICFKNENEAQELDLRSGQNLEQEKQACPDPGQVENAIRYEAEGGFDHGGVAYFTCDPNYCAEYLRTRTVEMKCDDGVWSNQPPKCVPCAMCAEPTQEELAKKKIKMSIHSDFTAHLACDEGYVIKAGTSIADGTVECIEGGIWSPEIPTCSMRPNVVCGPNSITVEINKNMLDSLGFSGGVNSMAMVGMNEKTEVIMKDCKPKLDDLGENYSFQIDSPFAGKCMTHFEHKKLDTMGNEANKYIFKNKIVWRQHSGAVLRRSTVLDFSCEYDGLMTIGLKGPIKLALSTRTYVDKRKGFGQQTFTVSMGIYANKDYTNLLDSSQVVHRGKRYFVALYLHEQDKGTPFLDQCYGSPNEISQTELIKMGRSPESDNDIRMLITDGCPAGGTLTRLELPGSTADRRFSFMYPYVSIDGYNANYMYIHCDLKLRPTGFKPSCVRPSEARAGTLGSGLVDESGQKLGENQFFRRMYGFDNDGYNFGQNMRNIQRYMEGQNLYGNKDYKNYLLNDPYKRDRIVPQTLDDLEKLKQQEAKDLIQSGNIMQKSSLGNANGETYSDQFEVFTGRKKRSVNSGNEAQYSVSIGPMVMIDDKDVKPEDIKSITIKTAIPLKAMPDGTVALDENAAPAESYDFTFNTTYVSREDDIEKFKKLLPEDRYVEPIKEHPGELIWESEKQLSNDKFSDDSALANAINAKETTEILVDDILEEIEEEEAIEQDNFAARAIAIIAGFLVGGGLLFALTLWITMKSSLCVDPVAKKNAAANANVPEKVVSGSCGTSQTSAEQVAAA